MASALVTILLWAGLATVAFKLSHLPPFFLTGAGLVIGGLVMLPGWRQWRVALHTFVIGVLALTLYHAALFAALQWAPAVSANLINYLWPLLIVVLAPIIQGGSRLSLRVVFAAILGFAGAALAILGDQKIQFETRSIAGYALALCAAVIWSSYSLSLKRLPPFPNAATGGFNLGAGILSLGISFASEARPALATNDWIYLVLIGAGPLGLAFFFWDKAAKTLPARTLGVLSFLTPVLSTISLLMVTGEMPGLKFCLGAVLVVAAILLALWSPRLQPAA
jgi:drug/metabolite transporter (DMT)-like permease